MLEPPGLHSETISICLQAAFEIQVVQVAFLPLGADQHTAVYRIDTTEARPYFLKLRSGHFDQTAVVLPKYLNDQGIEAIIPPLATRSGQLWTSLESFKVILYPFIEGHNGYEVELAERHWRDFGAALKRIHTTPLPPALHTRIRRETFSPRWRETLKRFVARVAVETFEEPIAEKVAAFLQARQAEISDLVNRAERLARSLQERPPDFILCHSDLHAGNIFIAADQQLYIVDWDEPILAPKERDLMYIGGGLLGNGRTPQEEESLFYPAYGRLEVDPVALAYYRYARIIEDLAIYCEQLLLTTAGGDDRAQSFQYLTSNFLPGGTIELAYRSDQTQ